jgi:hypothetical protein
MAGVTRPTRLAFSLLRDKIHNLGVAIEDPISSLIDKTLGTVIDCDANDSG